MAFHIKRKESVSKAIPRLVIEQIDAARACLEDCRIAVAVHSARKDLKKVRAVLVLVCKNASGKACKRLAKHLREPAKLLGGPRDLYVQVQTLDNLARPFRGQFPPGALRKIRKALHGQLASEMNRFTRKKSLRKVERALKRVRRDARALKIQGKGWRVISAGLKAAYADGLLAFEKARASASPKNLHAWRKQVKVLGYQLELLCKVWPEQLEAMREKLDLLGDLLGDHHDLSMLRGVATKIGADKSHSIELETLNALVEQRHAAIVAQALEVGANFYTEKPSIFCQRLAAYWKNWRRKARRAPQPAS